jgi:hypothetical protein
VVFAGGIRLTRARRKIAPGAFAWGATVAFLASTACGGKAVTEAPSPSPQDDAATDGATQVLPDTGADSSAADAGSDGGAMVVSEFPLGAYDCNATFDFGPNVPAYLGIAFANSSTLTLALSGSVVTATYSSVPDPNSPSASGALEFTLSTGNTASPAVSNQTFEVQCTPDQGVSPPSESLSVTSGSLTLDANALFLGFAGTFVSGGSSGDLCEGQPCTVSLVCTKQ